jgi:hypothetical protein
MDIACREKPGVHYYVGLVGQVRILFEESYKLFVGRLRRFGGGARFNLFTKNAHYADRRNLLGNQPIETFDDTNNFRRLAGADLLDFLNVMRGRLN